VTVVEAGGTQAAAAAPAVARGAARALPEGLTGRILALPLSGAGPMPGVLFALLAPDAKVRERVRQQVALLREPLTTALENDRRMRELVELRRSAEEDKRFLLRRLGRDAVLETVIGSEGGLKGVMERVTMAAPSDVPILILGETGSGKEVIARAIHARSRRSAGPFTRVNCGAIAPELVDSELFGHEKGSFTGATATRRGWFERSDGGTLLLDEIGELPKAAQVRLLRVLQDGSVQRVGGEKTLSVDVRVVAATHRDLGMMVQSGEFREDLWYRLAVFPLVLPPLRERPEDIPDLVEMLVRRASRRFGLRPRRPTADDLKMLTMYDWPGNVRELGSVIDRASILGEGRRLEIAKALGVTVGARTRARGTNGQAKAPDPTGEIASLDEAVTAHIRRALAAARGRIEGRGGAAEMLRINPHTLRARMRKLGIDWSRYRV